MDEQEMLVTAVRDLNERSLFACMERLAKEKTDSLLVMKWLQQGMDEVGKLYEQGDYFIADLIVAGILFKKAIAYLPPATPIKKRDDPLGRIVIGVMKGDIHDVGKDIVIQTLEYGGFEVIDLGVDVNDQAFVAAVEQYHPDFLMLCGLMSFSVQEMQKTIDRLKNRNLFGSCSVVVGGGCMDYLTSQEVGADYYSETPIGNLKYCIKVMEDKKHD